MIIIQGIHAETDWWWAGLFHYAEHILYGVFVADCIVQVLLS